jgi:hypothetical protein
MNVCPINNAACDRGCERICRNAPNDTLAVNDVRVEAGDYLLRHDHELRVIVVAENYAMVRRKGCAPFLLEMKQAVKLPLAKGGVRPKGWKLRPRSSTG